MEFQPKLINNSEVKMCARFIVEKHLINVCVSKLGTERVNCRIKQRNAQKNRHNYQRGIRT